MSAAPPRLLICDRYSRAHPKPRSGPSFYFPREKAFTHRWPFDAHFQAARSPLSRRLSNASIGVVPIEVTMLVADVDDPVAHREGTPARSAWREVERAKLDALRRKHPDVLTYDTRGGYRIVFALAVPFAIAARGDRFGWWSLYGRFLDRLAVFGIEGDPFCKDWTRLYRLPFVAREVRP